MGLFRYDFGYGFWWNYGHLLAIVPFAVLALVAWRLRWARWIVITSLLVAVWGVIGLLIVQFAMRLNLPLELPTQQFLTAGEGLVLDGGAGSGRATMMVLRERPGARVLAVDLYDGYFGIEDNTPRRLLDNATKAGVEGRVEARVGDLTDLQIEDASLDAAVSAFVIDHLSREDVERSLVEIERVLRPNGDFLLMVINPDLWIRIAYPFFVHHGYFGGRTNHERWRSRLEQAGFAVVEMGTVPGTLYLLARKGTGEVSSEHSSGRTPVANRGAGGRVRVTPAPAATTVGSRVSGLCAGRVVRRTPHDLRSAAGDTSSAARRRAGTARSATRT